MLLALLLALAPAAEATTIDFNDGSSGVPIDSAYVAQGIVFSNAAWVATSLAGTSPPIALVSLNMPFGSVIPETSAVVAEIHPAVDEVHVTAVDVGLAGARLEAYDEYPGGQLVASDEFFGTGAGVGNYDTLRVAAPGIRHIRLFQPGGNPAGADGLQFDDLVLLRTSTGVPAPRTGLSWARQKSRFSGAR